MQDRSEIQTSEKVDFSNWSPTWHDKLGGAAVYLFAIMLTLFAAVVLVGLAGNVLLKGSKVWNWTGLLVAGAVVFTNGRYAWMLNQASQRDEHPVPLAVALQKKTLRNPICVMSSCWWGGHIVMAVALLHLVVKTLIRMKITTFSQGLDWLLYDLYAFGLGYCSIGYLLLAVARWPVQPELLLRLWRLRIWLSVAYAVIGVVVLLTHIF